MCAKSPKILWLSGLGRTMTSQYSCPEIVCSSLMENIFPNSRCLSQSVPDPHHDQLVQVHQLLSGPLKFLCDVGAFTGSMNQKNINIKLCESVPFKIRLTDLLFCSVMTQTLVESDYL